MSHSKNRRYRKASDRRPWVFSELSQRLHPEQIAGILSAASLEQARLEAEAAQQHSRQNSTNPDVERPSGLERTEGSSDD